MTGQRMRIDVIIPTYQPDGRLHRLLARLCAQTRPPEKIILMNTEERYYRPEQYADIPNLEVHHVTKREFDHGGTRRQAMAYAGGDIAVFMTQDAVPKNQYLLEQLTAPIEAGLAQAAYARQLPAPGCRELEAFTREFNYPAKSRVKSQEDVEELGVKAYFCSNVCAAYLRAAYQEAGGFVSRAIFNEDMVLAARILQNGGKVAYAADACVIHSHNYTGLQQFHRNFDVAVSQAQHPEIFAGIPSEREGIRLVRDTARHFAAEGKWLVLPELLWISGWKFLGFQLGKRYRSLPSWLVRLCTMNRAYWEKETETEEC